MNKDREIIALIIFFLLLIITFIIMSVVFGYLPAYNAKQELANTINTIGNKSNNFNNQVSEIKNALLDTCQNTWNNPPRLFPDSPGSFCENENFLERDLCQKFISICGILCETNLSYDWCFLKT